MQMESSQCGLAIEPSPQNPKQGSTSIVFKSVVMESTIGVGVQDVLHLPTALTIFNILDLRFDLLRGCPARLVWGIVKFLVLQ